MRKNIIITKEKQSNNEILYIVTDIKINVSVSAYNEQEALDALDNVTESVLLILYQKGKLLDFLKKKGYQTND